MDNSLTANLLHLSTASQYALLFVFPAVDSPLHVENGHALAVSIPRLYKVDIVRLESVGVPGKKSPSFSAGRHSYGIWIQLHGCYVFMQYFHILCLFLYDLVYRSFFLETSETTTTNLCLCSLLSLMKS